MITDGECLLDKNSNNVRALYRLTSSLLRTFPGGRRSDARFLRDSWASCILTS